ncbi:MAG: hypothetical protein JW828_05655 [Sedimentisphaerales bacterium]|nr:hypothetical protein [Sedimentisphaerales bacterium]
MASLSVLIVAIPVFIGFGIVLKFIRDFTVPIMYLRRSTCTQAWREVKALVKANAGRFVVYILFQILINFVIGLIVFAIVICTCCIAGCFLAIPYIGTVLLLPVLVFERCYSLYYLAQYGPEYNVFGPEGPDGLPVEVQGPYPPSQGPMVPSQGPAPSVGVEPKTIFVGSDRPGYDLGVNQPMDYDRSDELPLDESSGRIEVEPNASDRDDLNRLRPPEPPRPPKPMFPSNPEDPWSQIPPPPPPPYDGQD